MLECELFFSNTEFYFVYTHTQMSRIVFLSKLKNSHNVVMLRESLREMGKMCNLFFFFCPEVYVVLNEQTFFLFLGQLKPPSPLKKLASSLMKMVRKTIFYYIFASEKLIFQSFI